MDSFPAYKCGQCRVPSSHKPGTPSENKRATAKTQDTEKVLQRAIRQLSMLIVQKRIQRRTDLEEMLRYYQRLRQLRNKLAGLKQLKVQQEVKSSHIGEDRRLL